MSFAALSIEILKAAGERSGGSLNGVAFLLHSDFLGDPAATYASSTQHCSIDDAAPELKSFLRNWSGSFSGRTEKESTFSNLVRILKWGNSPNLSTGGPSRGRGLIWLKKAIPPWLEVRAKRESYWQSWNTICLRFSSEVWFSDRKCRFLDMNVPGLVSLMLQKK
ncbi:UNVERIFIED_CONTAM: Ankyrin repeat protein SKIP35 [Sesamum angustifolium]|uniref:Ankyrin repeat protein SKIP35 n=1 Tax=Sesamum angustifolium TaxID=2727405 RepID=A0AAW2LUH2_9LAMI